MNLNPGYSVNLNTNTRFLLSTSGSESSIEKHNRSIRQLGLNLVYFTMAYDITPKEYAGLIKTPMIHGAAVTGRGGLKTSIIPFLDEVEEIARRTLAVNTVVNRNGKLYGYNTDAYGLKTALTKGIEETGISVKTAVIYGNGGVSGVAFHVLHELGIKATMIGRNQARVDARKRELGLQHHEHFEGPYDLVVDATPVSSNPDFLGSAGLAPVLDSCKIVFCHNMPEKDNKTNYLKAWCDDKKIPYIPGRWMYEAQLIKQLMLYFEQLPDAEAGKTITEQDVIEAWNLDRNI